MKMEDSIMFLPNHNTAHFHDSWKITDTSLETVMMNKKLLFHQGLNRVLHYKHCYNDVYDYRLLIGTSAWMMASFNNISVLELCHNLPLLPRFFCAIVDLQC